VLVETVPGWSARELSERIDRPPFRDRPLERDGRVEVGEGIRRRRVGEVVGGDVDRLHRGNRACARRRDALLKLAHLVASVGW
jgi:hypothetical protein